jgi:hypothetical protein
MLRKKSIVTVCGALLFAVSGYAQDTPIRPFKVNVSEESLADLPATHRRHAMARKGDGRRSVAGDAASEAWNWSTDD